jgi:hypothetical protein
MIRSFRIPAKYLVDVYRSRAIKLEFKDGAVFDGISHSTIDHPKFTLLREKLDKLAFIRIERGWWNGDSVLKAFRLNGHLFRKGDKFPCASAIAIILKVRNDSRRSKQKNHTAA